MNTTMETGFTNRAVTMATERNDDDGYAGLQADHEVYENVTGEEGNVYAEITEEGDGYLRPQVPPPAGEMQEGDGYLRPQVPPPAGEMQEGGSSSGGYDYVNVQTLNPKTADYINISFKK